MALNATSIHRRAKAGFTLIELAVVVTIIGILAAMAIPSLGKESRDRVAYDDAGSILELIRNARTHAVGRGAATMVTFTTSSSRGNYRMYEAVDPNATGGTNRTPRATCTNPTATSWADGDTRNAFLDGVNLDGTIESNYNIQSQVQVYDAQGAVTTPGYVAICFTPVGHAYYYTGNGPPSFSPAVPFAGTLQITVARLFQGQTSMTAANYEGIVRSILLPSSGNARMSSVNP